MEIAHQLSTIWARQKGLLTLLGSGAKKDSLWLESQNIAQQSDYLTQDSVRDLCNSAEVARYAKRDFLFATGSWRNQEQDPVSFDPDLKIFFAGHSALSTSRRDIDRLKKLLPKANLWVANAPSLAEGGKAPGSGPFPIGLTNDSGESALHDVYGNQSLIQEAVHLETSRAEKLTPYLNMSLHTAPAHRMVPRAFGTLLKHVEVRQHVPTREGRLTYLREMRRFGLVVCPRGRGHDTHRFYEALLVGAIPVVLEKSYSSKLARFFSLPVIRLRSWAELAGLEHISHSAAEVLKHPVSLDPVRRSFWRQKVVRAG